MTDLTRNIMTRAAKRDQLDGMKVARDERDKILNDLYGYEDSQLFLAEPKPRDHTVYIPATRTADGITIKPTLDVPSRTA